MRKIALLLCVAARMSAQLQLDTGAIAGTVTDPAGAPVPDATISITQSSRGLAFTSKADPDGLYRLPLLPPGEYTATFQAPNFGPATVAKIAVSVGETVRLDQVLDLASATFRAETTVRAPVVDFERSQQASSIQLDQIRNLPINRRNFLDFVLLTPGAVETTTIADGADYRIPPAPNSNFGFGGGNGRGNYVAIDGLSINGATGNVRPSLPQNAVEEFQVNRNSYSAEFGGASGGVVNIVSRAGGNAFRGEAFGFLRNRAFQARNYFDPGSSAYTREQSGVSFSGPLRRDRTFVFGAYERLDRHETVFVPLLTDPGILTRLTPSQQQLTQFLQSSGDPSLTALAGILRATLTPSNNPAVVSLFQKNSGVFPFSGRDNQASLRIDHNFSARRTLFLRANLTRETLENTKFGALVGLSHGNHGQAQDQTVTLHQTWSLSPHLIAITRAGFGRTRLLTEPNDPYGPEIQISGTGNFGRDYLFPFDQNERYFQFQQSFGFTTPHHAVKFGADLNGIRNSSRVETYFSGRFFFGEFFPLGLVLNAASGNPDFASGLAATLTSLRQPALAASLNNPLSSLQAYSLGLPGLYLQGFGNPTYFAWRQNHSLFVEDSWRVRPQLVLNAGLRYEFEGNADIHNGNNFGPRIGFAWSPFHSDTVIRGGYGIFYPWTILSIPFVQKELNRPDVSISFVPATGVAGVINPKTGQPLNAIDIYQYLLSTGRLGTHAIRQQDLAPLGTGAGLNYLIAGGVQKDFSSPYTQQASLQVERAFGDLALRVGYEFSRSTHVWRCRDINIAQFGTRPDGSPILGPIDPNVGQRQNYETSGNAAYHALILEAVKRLRNHVSLDAHYTWSKAIDDVTDFNIEYSPQNPLDTRSERGLSPFDQRHRVVISAILESPWRDRWRANWTVAPIFRANSASPFNALTGYDSLGDGQTTNHRPWGLGRDAGIGPAFYALDLRIARRVVISETRHMALTFLAEAFNLTNHTNFSSVNNIVGALPVSALPTPLTGHRGGLTDPLAFTSAFDPRQFQFGLKLNF